MNIKGLAKLSIFKKILTIPLITLALIASGVFFYVMPLVEQRLIDEKKVATKKVVDVAFALMTEYDARAKRGEFTLQEAKKRAVERVRQLRYEEKEYFWINDLGPTMIMHPYKPELEGTNLTGFKDPNGKALFVEFVRVCREKGVGFVEYLWPKPGKNEPVPKVSYVKLFEPWGWIIGSGIYVDDVNAAVGTVRWTVVLSVLVMALLSLILAFFIGRAITRPLKEFAGRLRSISEGQCDLTRKVEITGDDEIGELAHWVNRMIDSQRAMVKQMDGIAGQTASSVSVLKGLAEKTVEGAQRQSGQESSIATAAEEMNQTITDIAKNAALASEAATQTLQTALEGKDMAVGAIHTINGVYSSTTELSGLIGKLSCKVSEIGDIATVIKDIADQTNLLALNAAIEAARAGEQGRGFAVVADEVRKLAERTIRATVEITEKINAVQAESSETTRSMESASQEVTRATEYINRVGGFLNNISEKVGNVRDQVSQIAAAVDEQSATTDEVARNVESASAISKEIETMAMDVLQCVGGLQELSGELRAATSGFRT